MRKPTDLNTAMEVTCLFHLAHSSYFQTTKFIEFQVTPHTHTNHMEINPRQCTRRTTRSPRARSPGGPRFSRDRAHRSKSTRH